MAKIKFGTDGWRAIISEDFTFENVGVVAQAMADYIKRKRDAAHKKRHIVVGYDTRFLSEKYAEIISSVMAANGIKSILADRPTPTPSVGYAIKDRKLTGGVMITASHNPPKYNGIKYKDRFGASAGLEIVGQIEKDLGRNRVRLMDVKDACSRALVKVENIIPPHLTFARKYVNMRLIKKARLKVLADAMYGTGNDYLERFLTGGNIKVRTIHNERNPYFGGINPEPKLPNLKELQDQVRKGRCDVGLATDGDADRIGVIGPDGKMITGHKVISLILLHLVEDRGMRGDVVQTICGTGLIDKICEKYDLRMHETPVGFKYIAEIMVKEDVLIGGEEAGGISFKNYIPERDGILSGLLVLEMMAARKRSLPDLLRAIDKEYGTFEYRRIDLKYPEEKKKKLMGLLKANPPGEISGKKVVKIKDYDGHKFICQDGSWLLLRLSGTEPLLRVYAEASTEKEAIRFLKFGKKIAFR